MSNYFRDLNPVMQGLLAGLFTWGLTAAGAATVFCVKDMSKRWLDTLLGFAAGAMIFVVIEELIPESQAGGYTDQATIGALVGFTVMMSLDVILG